MENSVRDTKEAKEGTAEIRNAVHQGIGSVCTGHIYGDRKGRFKDGEFVSTSAIVGIDGDLIQTRNSLYRIALASPSPIPSEGPVAVPVGWNTTSNARHEVKVRDYEDKLAGQIGSEIEARIKTGAEELFSVGQSVVRLPIVQSLIRSALATQPPAIPSGNALDRATEVLAAHEFERTNARTFDYATVEKRLNYLVEAEPRARALLAAGLLAAPLPAPEVWRPSLEKMRRYVEDTTLSERRTEMLAMIDGLLKGPPHA